MGCFDAGVNNNTTKGVMLMKHKEKIDEYQTDICNSASGLLAVPSQNFPRTPHHFMHEPQRLKRRDASYSERTSRREGVWVALLAANVLSPLPTSLPESHETNFNFWDQEKSS
ncbi:hypothetical protein J6590_023819 [Homalodisca vitripennis]|nr:hypothetical protein J6590_023819 [Homalodisca vitripennis]